MKTKMVILLLISRMKLLITLSLILSKLLKKEATITIEKTGSGYTVRYPDNPKVKDYERTIRESVALIAEEAGQEFDSTRINLASIDDPSARTSFFPKIALQNEWVSANRCNGRLCVPPEANR